MAKIVSNKSSSRDGAGAGFSGVSFCFLGAGPFGRGAGAGCSQGGRSSSGGGTSSQGGACSSACIVSIIGAGRRTAGICCPCCTAFSRASMRFNSCTSPWLILGTQSFTSAASSCVLGRGDSFISVSACASNSIASMAHCPSVCSAHSIIRSR